MQSFAGKQDGDNQTQVDRRAPEGGRTAMENLLQNGIDLVYPITDQPVADVESKDASWGLENCAPPSPGSSTCCTPRPPSVRPWCSPCCPDASSPPVNISLILQQVLGTLAVGRTIVILTASIDLSCGAIMVLTSVVMAKIAADAFGGTRRDHRWWRGPSRPSPPKSAPRPSEGGRL